ncbi:MAG: right-handed parallel beta-helix repeat-containing protein [Candidatus Anstonellales archaeon]
MRRIFIFFFFALASLSYAQINATVFSYTEVPHTSVNLTPDSPGPGNDLICEAFVWNNDSFNMTVHFSWYKNGIMQDKNSTQENVLNGSFATGILSATETSPGDNWTCKAYACFSEAGEICGEDDNDSVVVSGWPTHLTQCQNITVPGEYILDADILDYPGKVCFFINVSDVLLDLKSHVVDGSAISSNAIAAFKAFPDPYNSPGYWRNITVINGRITDWNNKTSPLGYPAGLLVGNASNMTVENLSISSSGFPLLFNPVFGSDVDNLLARNVEISHSGTPIFNFVQNSQVENFYVRDSSGSPYSTTDGGYGMQVQGSSNMTIVNYSVRNVTWSSFYVIGNSNNITFENVSSELAGWGGFTILGSSNIFIRNANVEKTRGLWIHPFSQHAVFFENGQNFFGDGIFLNNNSNQHGISIYTSRNVSINNTVVDRNNMTVLTGINVTDVDRFVLENSRVYNVYNTVQGRGYGLRMVNVSNASIYNSTFENISCSFVDRNQDCGVGISGLMSDYYEMKDVIFKTCHTSYLSSFSSPVPAKIDTITFIDIMRAPIFVGLANAELSNIYIYNYTRKNEWMWAISISVAENTTIENITGENIEQGGPVFAYWRNTSVSNIHITSLTQSSPYYNRASAVQFYLSHYSSAKNILFTDIHPSNYAGGIGVFGSTNIEVENATCYGCGRGVSIGIQLPSTNITIRDSKFYNSASAGISIWGYSDAYWNHGIHIFNVSTYNSSGSFVYIQRTNNTIIENCTFSEMPGTYGYVYEAENLTIRNNIFKNGSFRVADSFADKTLIYNNIFNRSSVYDSGGNYWNTTYDCSQRSIINGDCIGGNWYSEYCGGDDGSGSPPIHNIAGDEIGDSFAPYVIEGGTAQDELPLTWNNESTCGKISECTTLRVSNMEYTLVNDIYGWKDDYACITVKAENITLNCSGYSITGDSSNLQAQYGIMYKSWDAGILHNMNFAGCTIKEYQNGIYLYGDPATPSDGINVSGNSIEKGYYGIYVLYAKNSDVKNNRIDLSGAGGYGYGISVNSANGARVINNTARGGMYGLYLSSSTNGEFDRNIFSDNTYNIYIERAGPSDTAYYRHYFTTNNFVGFGSDLKPVYYYVENKTKDGISTNPPENAGFVAFVDSEGFEARNLNLSNNSNGIIISNSSNINISNITSYYQALDGVYVLVSQNINANNLNILNSQYAGVYLSSSDSSSFRNLELVNNRVGGYSSASNNIHFENVHVNSIPSATGFAFVGNNMVWPPAKVENNAINNLYIENTRIGFFIMLLKNFTGENITIKNVSRTAIYSPSSGWPWQDYVNENTWLINAHIYQGSSPSFIWIYASQNGFNGTNISFMVNENVGVLTFPELHPYNSVSNMNNVRVDEWFVSLNPSQIPEYNRTANIRIRTDGCNNVRVYSLSGFPLSRAEIIQNGEVYPATINSCVANIVDFDVQEFTGYAANGTTKKPSGGGGKEEEEYIPPIIPPIEEKGMEECPPEEKTAAFGAASIPYNVNKYYPKDKTQNTAYLVISNAGDTAIGSFSVSYSGKSFMYSSLAPGEFLFIKTTYTGDPCQPASIIPAFAPPEEIIIDAPLEVPVGSEVDVNVSYVNGSEAGNINIVVTNPLNRKIYYLTDKNGRFRYVAENEGAYVYSAPGYAIRKSVITYAYLKEAKSLIIPMYITQPTKIFINVYSFGISIDSSVKIKDPYGVEKEVEARGGRYEDYISLPGRYVFTITPFEKVQSISARIELEKAPFILPLFEKLEFWLMLLLIIALILAVDYYRTKLAPKPKLYSLVLLTKMPYAGKPVKVRIVDSKGNPVQKASAYIYLEYEGLLVDEKKTDINGMFSFVPKEKGKYLIECEGAELKKNEIVVQ